MLIACRKTACSRRLLQTSTTIRAFVLKRAHNAVLCALHPLDITRVYWPWHRRVGRRPVQQSHARLRARHHRPLRSAATRRTHPRTNGTRACAHRACALRAGCVSAGWVRLRAPFAASRVTSRRQRGPYLRLRGPYRRRRRTAISGVSAPTTTRIHHHLSPVKVGACSRPRCGAWGRAEGRRSWRDVGCAAWGCGMALRCDSWRSLYDYCRPGTGSEEAEAGRECGTAVLLRCVGSAQTCFLAAGAPPRRTCSMKLCADCAYVFLTVHCGCTCRVRHSAISQCVGLLDCSKCCGTPVATQSSSSNFSNGAE